MPIDIRQIAMTPEGRLAQRLADLERRNGMLERGHTRNRKYHEVLRQRGGGARRNPPESFRTRRAPLPHVETPERSNGSGVTSRRCQESVNGWPA